MTAGAMVLRVALAVAMAAALGVACSSDREDSTGPDGDGSCGASPPAGVVQIRDYEFRPSELRVSPGQSVRWINCGNDQHTSTSDTNVWASNFLAPGQSFTRTFDTAGTFPYFCEPHAFMRARIVVQ